MYLPRFVPLSPPYMATWRGKSGKAYEFGVTDRGYSLRDGPAVAILVEHRPDGITVPLWVGRNSWDAASGWRFDPPTGQWQDGGRGRLTLHVRFEALWASAQQTEIDDLIAALNPPLNARLAVPATPPAVVMDAAPAPVAAPRPAVADAASATPVVTTGVPANTDAPPPSIPAPMAAEPPVATVAANAAARPSPFARFRATIERLLGGSGQPEAAHVRVSGAPPSHPVAPEPVPPSTSLSTPVPARTIATTPVTPLPATAAAAADARPAPAAVSGEAADRVPPAPVAAMATVVETPPPMTPPVRVVASEPAVIAESTAPREIPVAADRPVAVLFAGEMAHATGVDILVEAAAVVAGDPIEVRFLFVGDGPLKAAMIERASAAGFAQRCRFLGHLGSDEFTAVLSDADIVVVPGRVAQDRSVARRALAAGRWLLTTHQACIDGVEHGRNGLVTYDNPGSLVWGLRELMGRIMHHRRTSTDRRAA